MEERATSRSASVVMKSSAWFWMAMALIFFCVWLNDRVTARQSGTTGTEGQASEAPVEPGDVHARKVTLIGSIVGKNQLTSLDPRAIQDRRVVKVAIGLDDPALAARFVNMEVEATIKPGTASAGEPAAGTAGR